MSDDECVHLARIHRLHVWVSEDGTKVEYRSSQYSKFTGIEVRIVRNVVTMKTSLHKFWNNRMKGLLRNNDLFTVSEAKSAFDMLLFENGFLPAKTRVVQFEIGLNLRVSYDPLSFIEQARYITQKDKFMFIDANFRINRQRTTEKHRDIRKYFKIYDKGFEMLGKIRNKDFKELKDDVNVLRIETVYKRHSEWGHTFFSDANIKRLVDRFYVDWKDLFFFRNVRADKGTKKSEVERAKLIINNGADEYMEKMRAEYDEGRMTEKQFRTIREFVRDFELNAARFKVVISPQEREYKRLLIQQFNAARV